ncbi:hypothetical protein D9M68_610600 [compost metagenome]
MGLGTRIAQTKRLPDLLCRGFDFGLLHQGQQVLKARAWGGRWLVISSQQAIQPGIECLLCYHFSKNGPICNSHFEAMGRAWTQAGPVQQTCIGGMAWLDSETEVRLWADKSAPNLRGQQPCICSYSGLTIDFQRKRFAVREQQRHSWALVVAIRQ